jgi:Zn-finger nucleic acid-binding protein
MTDRQGIEIDYCPECRGVWLDRGELDKIIERSAPQAAPAPTDRRDRDDRHQREDRHDRDDRDEQPKKKKKRGGFLENLFDFEGG